MSSPRRFLVTAFFACFGVLALGGAPSALAAGPPTVITSYNTPEAGGRVRLLGYVNPEGAQVGDCHFEYGLQPNVYVSAAPCDTSPGAGSEAVEATAHLTGLTPGATYHYRLLAANASGTTPSLNATFRVAEEPASSCPNPDALGANRLSECRAWEMVSPPVKNGADVVDGTQHVQVAADGSAASFASLAPFGDASGAAVVSEYMSNRTPSRWLTHGILPPQPPTTEAAFLKTLAPLYETEFSSDLNSAVAFAWRPIDKQDPNVAEVGNLYLRDDLRSAGPGHYQLLTACPLCAESKPPKPISALEIGTRPFFIEADTKFAHVLFESRLNLVAGTKGGEIKLYEWSGGTVQLVGILPNGKIPLKSAAGLGADPSQHSYTHHAISADGSKVFFTAEDNLYMRLDGEQTAQLNLPEEGVGPASAARFWDASSDGSRAFFTSVQSLTKDAADDGQNKLYMYDTTKSPDDPHNLTLLSVNRSQSSPSVGSEVAGVIGASENGRTVYFVDLTQLQFGAPQHTANAQKIFVWHDGEVHFLSTVGFSEYLKMYDTTAGGYGKHARVSADGQLLILFRPVIGAAGPTGYDQGKCGSLPCFEEYVYDPETEALQCSSCQVSGKAPTADAVIDHKISTGAVGPSTHLTRVITDNGHRAFFSTSEGLSSEDTDGASDAYVFDTLTATVSLLSSGTDHAGSYFMDASANGADAFFTTAEPLSGWDIDPSTDLYDARIGGGLPEPPALIDPCQGESCRPAAPTAPPRESPGSPIMQGPPDPTPKRCSARKHCKRRRGGRNKGHKSSRPAHTGRSSRR